MNEWLLYVEVEENPNSEVSLNLVYKALEPPGILRAVRLYDDTPNGEEWEVTGWSSDGGGTPIPAQGTLIADSGAGDGYLVWGGDWGIRVRRPGSGAWSIAAADQRGDSHFVLSDSEDLIYA
ncbi:MAG: hypothetical protein NTZ05_18845, partial [Chloroflexi bacterium]|nr:hypothetical protein [Chloroflexota bacterium]